MLNKGGNGMKKTLTMQEILNDNQLLNALSKFREESEIKEFCKQHSLEINSTILYNLKKTLECQIEQIENANKPLTVETLKDVAGGDDSDNYGYKNGYWYCLMGGTDAGSVFNFISQEASNLVLNVVFGYEGYKSLQAAKAAEAASLASEAAKGRATDFPDLASMDVDRDILTN